MVFFRKWLRSEPVKLCRDWFSTEASCRQFLPVPVDRLNQNAGSMRLADHKPDEEKQCPNLFLTTMKQSFPSDMGLVPFISLVKKKATLHQGRLAALFLAPRQMKASDHGSFATNSGGARSLLNH